MLFKSLLARSLWLSLATILRYLKETLDLGILLHSFPSRELVAYSDVDWIACSDTRHSTSGFCLFLGDNLISWSSRQQPQCHGLVLMLNTMSLQLWLLKHVGCVTFSWSFNDRCILPPSFIVTMSTLSTLLITLVYQTHWTRIHFLREKIVLGSVCVPHGPSTSKFANIFTNELQTALFREFISLFTTTPLLI
jgi:hypothetical protein